MDFWLHTTLCATLCVELYERNGEYIGHTDEDEVFSAAILHDIGKLILNQYDAENYQKIVKEINASVDYETLLKLEQKYCMLAHDFWDYPRWNTRSQRKSYHLICEQLVCYPRNF